MKNPLYRQGDVLIEQIAEIPITTHKQETSRRVVLARGEATGHHHVLTTDDPADWWKKDEATAGGQTAEPAGEIFLSLPGGATVSHEEHAPIELPPGNYRVTRQREYTPKRAGELAAAFRNVTD
jgi:hypothetical protein